MGAPALGHPHSARLSEPAKAVSRTLTLAGEIAVATIRHRSVWWERHSPRLGALHFDRLDPGKLAPCHVRRLAELGSDVKLEARPAARSRVHLLGKVGAGWDDPVGYHQAFSPNRRSNGSKRFHTISMKCQ